jgi:hypothetical protein
MQALWGSAYMHNGRIEFLVASMRNDFLFQVNLPES